MWRKLGIGNILALIGILIAVLVLLYGDNWLGWKPKSANETPPTNLSPTPSGFENNGKPDTPSAPVASGRKKSTSSSQTDSSRTADDPQLSPNVPSNQPSQTASEPTPLPTKLSNDPDPSEYEIGKLRIRTFSPRIIGLNPARLRVRFNLSEPSHIEYKTPIDFELDDQISEWRLETATATCRGDPASIDRGTKNRPVRHRYELIPGADSDFFIEFVCGPTPRAGESVTSRILLKVVAGSFVEGRSDTGLILYTPTVPPIAN